MMMMGMETCEELKGIVVVLIPSRMLGLLKMMVQKACQKIFYKDFNNVFKHTSCLTCMTGSSKYAIPML